MSVIYFKKPEAVMIRIRKSGSTSIVRGIFGGNKKGERRNGVFPKEWENFYTFAFVRNPFDRLVSSYKMFKTYEVNTSEEETFRDSLSLNAIMDVIEDDSINLTANKTYMDKLRLHAIPMTHEFYHIDKVQDIYRFENFEQEYMRLLKQLNLPPPEAVPHFKKNEKSHYSAFYDHDTRLRAGKLYEADCEKFHYTFDSL